MGSAAYCRGAIVKGELNPITASHTERLQENTAK